VDERNEKLPAKIRDAQLAQVPYMLVIGGREATQQTVAVRHRRDGDLGAMSVQAFVSRLSHEAATYGTK
jgi:threonyl-tRNA synthetase